MSRYNGSTVYIQQTVWVSCRLRSGHRIRRNITVINQRQTGAEVTTVWQFSPAARSPSLRPHFAGNSTCSRGKRRILWPKKKIDEKEKQLHKEEKTALCALRDTARRTKRGGETALVLCARDWSHRWKTRFTNCRAFTRWFRLTYHCVQSAVIIVAKISSGSEKIF